MELGKQMDSSYTSEQIIGFMRENWPEIYATEEANALKDELFIYLGRVYNLSVGRTREVLSEFNLCMGEFDILLTLRRSPKPHVLTPTELQRSMLITSGGLTKLLYQLEARELISRSVQPQDKRSKLVHLTAKGKRLAERSLGKVRATSRNWLDQALTERENEQLRKLLSKAAAVLEQPGND